MSLYLLIIMVLALPVLIPIGIIYLIIRIVKYNKQLKQQNNLMFQQFINQNNTELFCEDNKTEWNSTAFPQQKMPDIYSETAYNQNIVKAIPKKQREPLGSSTIMLIVGVILMVLSGIAFAAANWVNMTPFGRVGVIMTAAAISFLISFIFKKAAKLNNTSSSFYILGCLLISVAVLTIGIYKLFGNWFSFSGNGAGLLLAAASLISSFGAFLGKKIYKTKVFLYTGLYLASATLTFTAFETTYLTHYDSFGVFAVILILMQILITASIHLFRIHKDFTYSKAVTTVADVTSVFYAVIGLVYVLSNLFEPNNSSLFILTAIIIQLIIYGVNKNKKWMLGIQCFLSVYNAFQLSSILTDDYNLSVMIFAFLVSSIYFINNFIPKLKNTFSTVTGLISLFIAVNISLIQIEVYPLAVTLIIPITAMIVVYMYCFNPNKTVQFFAGILSTVTPLLIMSSLADESRTYITKMTRGDDLVFAITSIFLSIVPLVIMNVNKIAPKFAEKYPLKSDKVLYSNIISSGIILVSALYYPELIFMHFAAVAVNVFTSFKLKNNISLVLPIIWSFAYIGNIASHQSEIKENTFAVIFFIMFMIVMSLSFTVFRKAFITKKHDKTLIDVSLLTGWMIIPELSYHGYLGEFLSIISFAIYVSCFAKQSVSKQISSIIYSVSAITTAWALITRPFLVPQSDSISFKITLAIITLTGLAFQIIWKHNPSAAKILSNIIYICAFISLLANAVDESSASNTLFVLCVTTAILIISYMSKSKTWFMMSITAMIFIIGYASREYLTSLSWWVYLFVAGLVLIGIAAANEYFKQKSETLKSKMSSLFVGWNW